MLAQTPGGAWAAQVLGADLQVSRDQVRIVLDTDSTVRFRLLSLRKRLVLELEDAVASGPALDELPGKVPENHALLGSIRVARLRPRGLRLQIELKAEVEPRISSQRSAQGFRLVLELSPGGAVTPALEEMFLEMRLNRQPGQNALILRQADGALYARKDDLQRWRLHLPEVTPLAYRGEEYYPLAAFAGLTYRVDEARQVLMAEAPASLFSGTEMRGASSRLAAPTRPPPGAFLNYDLLLNRTQDSTQRSGVLELGAFGGLGVGVTSFLAQPRAEGTRVVRLDSTWTYDRPEKLDSLRFGDAISGAGSWARAVRFGGAQWATNFSTQPGLVTFPLPGVTGEAVVPSTVDLYVNDALRLSREVPSGPFTITDLPVVSGRGEARLVVRDLLGREQLVVLPYYATPRLLQKGLHDYSYEVGAVRDRFSLASGEYGRGLAAGTHRVGLTDRFTGEVRGELLNHQKTGGLGAAWLWPQLGVLSASAAASTSERGHGGLAGLGFERQGRVFGLGASAPAASPRFVQLGLQPEELAPRQQSQAFASLSTPGFGSLGFGYTHRAFRDRPDVDLVSATYGLGIARVAFASLAVIRSLGQDARTSATLMVTIPLGERSSAAVTSLAQKERHQTLAQAQQSLPAGEGFGYRVLASVAGPDRHEGSLAYQSTIGTYTLEAGRAEGLSSVRAGATGGVALLEGLHFTRRMTDSFGIVKVPDQPNVRVYADNQLVARTDAGGTAFVPRLRPYEVNRIAIEHSDLPLETEIDSLSLEASPYFRSGLLMRFGARPSHAALITVVLDNGAPLPAGAVVRVGEAEFPVGLRGEVYLTGLSATNRARVSWRGQSCEFDVAYAASADPQPHLGTYTCRGVRP
jgi:outer membrane usher protein